MVPPHKAMFRFLPPLPVFCGECEVACLCGFALISLRTIKLSAYCPFICLLWINVCSEAF